MESVPPKSTSRKKRFSLIFLLALLLTLGFALVFRAAILTALADLWIVDEKIVTADAIVVLGGNAPGRAGSAAELYARGIAPRIVAMNVALTESDQRGFSVGETDRIRQILVEGGVPTNSITFIGKSVTSSHEEALALREWVKSNKPQAVIIPTDLFHTRRVNWWFENILEETSVDVHVIPVPMTRYSVTNWWRHEDGLLAFQNEILKTGFYFFRY